MKKVCSLSLFSVILACVSTMPVNAAIKAKNSNRSYAGAYQQVNAMRYQQEVMDNAYVPTGTTTSATESLPVAVDDPVLSNAILNGTTTDVGVDDLESCAMIYPNGLFKWGLPESGYRRTPVAQCVSVVELRDATTKAVLATTTLASGDSMKCNIDYFPESKMNAVALQNTILPADTQPTMADVEAVMNQEQKQNAGLKIAAAAVISGVAGNILAPKSAGNSKMFGTGKTELVDTAIGAATGASIMAASSFSGHVAGETIKSTAVNAASGMIVGNMLAGTSGGNSILVTMKCKPDGESEKDCIPGTINEKSGDTIETSTTDGNYFIEQGNWNHIIKCERDSYGYKGCESVNGNYVDKVCDTTGSQAKTEYCEKLKDSEYGQITNKYKFDSNSKTIDTHPSSDGNYLVLKRAVKTNPGFHAYVVFEQPLAPSMNGYTKDNWDDTSSKNALGNKTKTYYRRDSDGSVGKKYDENEETFKFEPQTMDASDGGLVDMSNKARAKGTIAGAATGGAMGGFAGYQGAKDEVSERWTAAVREYQDSLSNFVCFTGGRFLSRYNDEIQIPVMKQSE